MKLSDLFTIACAVLAACGLVAGFVGVRRLIRMLRTQHCPWCGYDLRGLASGVCPECGPRPRPGRWRAAGWLAVAPVLVAMLPLWLMWPRPFRMAWWWVRYPTWRVTGTTDFGRLVLRFEQGGRPDNETQVQYEALLDGRVFRQSRGYFMGIGSVWDQKTAGYSIDPAVDLNRDGVPEIILRESSGGTHCCHTAYVYDTSGSTPVLLATVAGEHSPPSFEDLDRDGVAEAIVQDWTWDYFYSFAEAPAPRVILRWTGAEFVVAPNLMRTETPDEKTLAGYDDELKAAKNYLSVPPPMLHRMLELMYTGHGAAAWRLFDRVYPQPTREQEEWLEKFRRSLEASPYWPSLHAAWGAGE